MHELRLLEVCLGIETAMNKYYDFKLGKYHLRGYGWPGLVALGILWIPLVVEIFDIPTTSMGSWMLQQINHLVSP
jgi:hypothetical protein